MALLFNDIKDDVFTIPLPNSDLIFTRYLYIKDEVKISLLLSLLEKNENALFWANELFTSGFKQETFAYIWQIYYDFYATLNPSFENYLLKKHIEWNTNVNNTNANNIITDIIQHLLVCSMNTDVYLLRNICDQFEIDIEYKTTNITSIETHDLLVEHIGYWVETEEYRSLAQTILFTTYQYNYTLVYTDCLHKVFPTIHKKNTLLRSFVSSLQVPVNPKVILFAKIMELCTRKKGLKQNNNEIKPITATIDLDTNVKVYNVLKHVYNKWPIHNNIWLFKLVRNKYSENGLKKAWLHNWEYHASFSPLWLDRIKRGGGYINYTYKRLEFINDECMEAFYSQYGYEPDEQPVTIRDKVIGPLDKDVGMLHLCNNNSEGLFIPFEEELEQLYM